MQQIEPPDGLKVGLQGRCLIRVRTKGYKHYLHFFGMMMLLLLVHPHKFLLPCDFSFKHPILLLSCSHIFFMPFACWLLCINTTNKSAHQAAN